MYNKIVLVGNLTRDIDLHITNSGTQIAKTAIATSRKFTSNGEKKEEVCFTDITFFGRSAEVANQYLKKGSKCLVEGRLMFEQWTDQQSGQKRSKHSVTVETMQMLGSATDNASQQSQGPQMQKHYEEQSQMENNPNYPTPQQSYQTNENGQYVPQQQQQQYQPQQQASEEPQHQVHPNQGSLGIDEDEIPF